MCLILTIFAAALCSGLWYRFDRSNVRKIGTLALMFWGASLMWLVDSVFAVFGGEPFFDISMEDAVLGFIIIFAGVIFWAFLRIGTRLAFARV